MNAIQVYDGSDGATTRAYYADLCRLGVDGVIAMNLFRAQKCSSRAKKYRGGIRGKGSYKHMAYDRKNYSLKELCKALMESKYTWGWKPDPEVKFGEEPSWVLYVELPEGQVSFHSKDRFSGPDFNGEWDKQRLSCERILAFCDRLVGTAVPAELF